MNILLTNDDGYKARGIILLRKLLSKYGNVIICAPRGPMSGKSLSITIDKPFHVIEEEKGVFSIDGTPADCVRFAHKGFNIDFDLVVSGCNHGWNVSFDTLYSGTVGAALQACNYDIKSLAISCQMNFDIVEKYFDEVMKFILDHDLMSEKYILNINFPLGEEIKGIALGHQFDRKDEDYIAPYEDGYQSFRRIPEDYSSDPDSDCYQVRNGIVSIVPLKKVLYQESLYEELLKKINK